MTRFSGLTIIISEDSSSYPTSLRRITPTVQTCKLVMAANCAHNCTLLQRIDTTSEFGKEFTMQQQWGTRRFHRCRLDRKERELFDTRATDFRPVRMLREDPANHHILWWLHHRDEPRRYQPRTLERKERERESSESGLSSEQTSRIKPGLIKSSSALGRPKSWNKFFISHGRGARRERGRRAGGRSRGEIGRARESHP